MNPKPIILIIDDEPAIGELLAYEFLAHSFEVDLAESGHEATRQFEKNRPDAVICDLHLQGLSGPSLVKQMKSENPNLPFIFMTGGLDFSIIDTYRCGADDLFLKPFKRSEISASIIRMLQRTSLERVEPYGVQAAKTWTVRLTSKSTLLSNSHLLFGRHGVYVFTDDDLPNVNDIISLNIKNDDGPLAVLTGCVRFIYSTSNRGFGLEIYSVSGNQSSELKTFFKNSKDFFALPLPDACQTPARRLPDLWPT